jgi:hypothetical protein
MSSLEQLTKQIRDSRRTLGEVVWKAAQAKILSENQAKALNTHLGVAEPKVRLSQGQYSIISECLEGIAERITSRREYLQTHRIVLPDVRRKLGESTVLALAVGVGNDDVGRPLTRRELEHEPIVMSIAAHRVEPTSVAIDRAVINDLHWLAAPTRPK